MEQSLRDLHQGSVGGRAMMTLNEEGDLHQRHHRYSGIVELDFSKVKMAS